MYSLLMYSLRLLKMLYDMGIYEKAVHGITEISEDDYYELALRGLEHVAPSFEVEELGEDVCCGGHVVYHFSDPAIPEFTRLCRIYEYKHSITPAENPYFQRVNNCYEYHVNYTSGRFATDYDDTNYPRGIWIETCPEQPAMEHELIELVYYLLERYRIELENLRTELLSGPIIWLPALPAHQPKKKKRKAANNLLKKAS